MATKTVFDAEGNEYEMELDEDDAGGGVPDTQRTPAEWAKLRRSEKAARDAKVAADQAARVLAFYRAGINPDDPRMGYFVKGYDGELSTAAIRDAATTAGFLSGDEAPSAVDATGATVDADGASHAANRAITAAGTGASPDERTPVAALIEAEATGGRNAIIDQLRAAGVPIQYEGQE